MLKRKKEIEREKHQQKSMEADDTNIHTGVLMNTSTLIRLESSLLDCFSSL